MKGKVNIFGDYISYNMRGGKGAPIFSRNGEVVGMHLSSKEEDSLNKGILFNEKVKQYFFNAIKASMGLKARKRMSCQWQFVVILKAFSLRNIILT